MSSESETEYADMPLPALQARCEELNLDQTGQKAELVRRLVDYLIVNQPKNELSSNEDDPDPVLVSDSHSTVCAEKSAAEMAAAAAAVAADGTHRFPEESTGHQPKDKEEATSTEDPPKKVAARSKKVAAALISKAEATEEFAVPTIKEVPHRRPKPMVRAKSGAKKRRVGASPENNAVIKQKDGEIARLRAELRDTRARLVKLSAQKKASRVSQSRLPASRLSGRTSQGRKKPSRNDWMGADCRDTTPEPAQNTGSRAAILLKRIEIAKGTPKKAFNAMQASYPPPKLVSGMARRAGSTPWPVAAEAGVAPSFGGVAPSFDAQGRGEESTGLFSKIGDFFRAACLNSRPSGSTSKKLRSKKRSREERDNSDEDEFETPR